MYAFYNINSGEVLSLVQASSQPEPPTGYNYVPYAYEKQDMHKYEVSDGVLQRKAQTQIDATELTQARNRLRRKRDQMLASSDWTQAADSPVDKVVWASYRQALRDLPANTSDPVNPVWPRQPR